MKRTLILLCALAISGCNTHQNQKPEVVSPVKQGYSPTHHADWKDVKGTTWSLQLPSTFEEQELTEAQEAGGIKFAEFSKEMNTLVIFSTDTTKKSVDDFTGEFNAGLVGQGGEILNVRKANPGKGLAGLDTTLTLLSINDNIFVVQFIAINGQKVYLLGCTTSEHPKEVGPLCMEVMHTVKIEQ
jgi:hypothetical protein